MQEVQRDRIRTPLLQVDEREGGHREDRENNQPAPDPQTPDGVAGRERTDRRQQRGQGQALDQAGQQGGHWRLGLLAIATVPLYAAAMAMGMRGMAEETVEMDAKLSVVSARMVEFVTGITVVKAFGRVGRAHGAYQDPAGEFQEFYYAWVKPLLRVSSLGMSLLAVPLILLINLGGGAWLVHRGDVTAAEVVATSLIALLTPYGIEVLMNSMWSSQMAGASARRLTDLLGLRPRRAPGCRQCRLRHDARASRAP